MIQELIDALRVQSTDDAIALPNGCRLIPAESFLINPDDARGHVEIESIDSLVAYFKGCAGLQSACFASRKKNEITAVADWHWQESRVDSPNTNPVTVPGWGEHTATMKLVFTDAWNAWNGISGKPIDQKAFAEFIEENLEFIANPTAAQMLTIATTLEGKKNVNFKNGIRLQSGDIQLNWEEDTQVKTAGDVKIPAEITLKIPVYRGAEKETTVEIRALFRYAINSGRLTFTVKLIGADAVAELAFTGIVDSLRESFTKAGIEAPVYLGAVATKPRDVLLKRNA